MLAGLSILAVFALRHAWILPYFELAAFAVFAVVADDDAWGWPAAARVREAAFGRLLLCAVPLLGRSSLREDDAAARQAALASSLKKSEKYIENNDMHDRAAWLQPDRFLRTPLLRRRPLRTSAPA